MQSTSSESLPDTTIIRTGSDGRLRYTPAQRGELLDGPRKIFSVKGC